MKANEFVKKFGLEKSKMAVRKLLPMEEGMPVFDYNSEDLKRLVESHELVNDYYGLTRAKEHAESNYTAPELKAALKQAIADVESCS